MSGDSRCRVGRPFHLPDRFAGGLLHRENVGRIVGLHAVQHLHVEAVAVHQRRRCVAVVEAEAAIVGLDVALPDLGAVHRKTGEFAVAGDDPDVLAVGDRRGRSGVLLAEQFVAAVDLALPADHAVLAIERQQENLVGPQIARAAPAASRAVAAQQRRETCFGGSDEHRVFPDDRRGGAPTGEFRAPQHVIGMAPGDGQVPGVGCTAVRIRAAPLRPVGGQQIRRHRGH